MVRVEFNDNGGQVGPTFFQSCTQSQRSPRSAGRCQVRLSKIQNSIPQSLTWRRLPLTEETVDSGHEIDVHVPWFAVRMCES